MSKTGEKKAEKTILDEDNIPNENQSFSCFSCGTKIDGLYCSGCGQKNDDYRRSIFSLFGELVGSFTSLEARIWRTWAALLFRPGKVAREFADGKRTKWSSPVRVFIAMSIIVFGFLSITNTQLVSLDIDIARKDGVNKPTSELTASDLKVETKARYFQTQKQIEQRNKARDFDLINIWLDKTVGIGMETDKTNELDDTERQNDKNTDQDSDLSVSADLQDLDKKSRNQIREMLYLAIKNPTNINSIIYNWLPKIVIIMMPITMLLGYLFIRRRGNALLYDHLVHVAYIHSVGFFMILLGILLMKILPGNWVALGLFGIMLIYIPISIKTMFGRGWLKTMWMGFGVGFLYSLIFIILFSIVFGWQISKLASSLV